MTVNSDRTGVPPESIFCNQSWVAASGYEDFCFGTSEAWACPGDSGGPIYGRSTPTTESGAENTIYGVTSFGGLAGCGSMDEPVGQPVGPHVEWVNGVVAPVGAGDEMFFYRSTDGAYRYYTMRPDGTLSTLLQGGTGYSLGWNSITAVNLG